LDDCQYLFVYGSLKKGFKNEHILQDYTFLSTCSTLEKYEMYPTSCYSFPCLFISDREIGKNVKGELYKVNNELLKILDIFEGVNSGFYSREKISVTVHNNTLMAFCYVTNTTDDIISNIDLTPSPLQEWTIEYENCAKELELYSLILKDSVLNRNIKQKEVL